MSIQAGDTLPDGRASRQWIERERPRMAEETLDRAVAADPGYIAACKALEVWASDHPRFPGDVAVGWTGNGLFERDRLRAARADARASAVMRILLRGILAILRSGRLAAVEGG